MNNSIWYRGLGVIILCGCAPALFAFQLGIETVSPEFFSSFRFSGGISYRIGLISNQTGVTQDGERTVDLLVRSGMRIVYLLAPEHGFDGAAPAGKPIADSVDKRTGIPIASVYGRGGDYTIAGKRINPDLMKQIDVLFYDIQDSGMRHYTYISTLLCALEAAAEHKKPIVVFDRPNYLGPNMEGPLVEPKFKSFISIAPIPLRHGMTVAELAHYFNKHILKEPAKLHVMRMRGYTRTMNPKFLAQLSPNLPSTQSLYGYSFLGIMGEIEPFDVAVGTPYAFQAIMLPDSAHFPQYEWSKVMAILRKYNIQSTHHMLAKNRQTYTGLKLHISSSAKVTSFALLAELIQFFKQAGVKIAYSRTFDKALGTDMFRQLCDGLCSNDQLKSKVGSDLEQFHQRAKECYLYKPEPQVK